MKCPKCAAEVDSLARICPGCGESLTAKASQRNEVAFCTLCGHNNNMDFFYCEKCGTKLKSSGTSRGPLPLDHNAITALLAENKTQK